MAAATVETIVETGCPSIEVIRLELTDAETYQSRKFSFIEAAGACLNKDRDTTMCVEDDDSSVIDGTQDGVIINGPNISDDTVSLILVGRK